MELGYKLAMLSALLFPTIALYFVVRHRFGLVPAAISAGLFFFDLEVTHTILEGMWNNYLALGFLLLLMGRVFDFPDTPTRGKAVGVAFLLLAVILSHLYTAVKGAQGRYLLAPETLLKSVQQSVS